MRLVLGIATVLVLVPAVAAAAAEPAPPIPPRRASLPRQASFTKKPSAARADGKVRIEFAVDRETDVAVYVEDTKGGIVRHLAAGVLGANAPEPLRSGLSQSLDWDGKDDDGKQAYGGPLAAAKPSGEAGFKVRVGLGLAVTDRNLYVADSINRRVLRVKLDYAASETAAVP